MKVILADDSALILERLQEMVSRYQQVEIVGSLKNGTDALAALRNLKPDLAIVDIRMPGLTGLEVLAEIRKVDKVLKFIILTFYSSEYLRQKAFQSGADYFFSKVDDFDKVTEVVEEMILREEHEMKIKMPDA
ncbi:MAG: response regulator [Bacteroidia bacterium]|nr:response regulator [Bacteroidia bacterium]